MNNSIWHQSPADSWAQRYPIGTGRLTAMVEAAPRHDRVAVGHERLCGLVADVCIDMDHGERVLDYSRELDIDMAFVTTRYAADGGRYEREYIAHMDRDIILLHYTADRLFSADFRLQSRRKRDHQPAAAVTGNILTLDAVFDGSMDWRVQVQLHPVGGRIEEHEEHLRVVDVSELVVEINIGVHDNMHNELAAHSLVGCGEWPQLMQQHIDAFRNHYGGFVLHIPGVADHRTTTDRLAALQSGASDGDLVQLLFNFGRYLIVCGAANAQYDPGYDSAWLDAGDTRLGFDPTLALFQLAAESASLQGYVGLLEGLKDDDYDVRADLVRVPHDGSGVVAMAWKAMEHVRAGDGTAAFRALQQLIRTMANDALLPVDDSGRVQLGPAFIGVAVIPAMLLDDADGVLHFLPALPEAWPAGKAYGLSGGGFSVSVEWTVYRVHKVVLACGEDCECAVRQLEGQYKVVDSDGEAVEVDCDDGVMRFSMKGRSTYMIERVELQAASSDDAATPDTAPGGCE
jgi:hypothetical protein